MGIMNTEDRKIKARNGLTSLNSANSYPFAISLDEMMTYLLHGVIESLQGLDYRQIPYSIDSLTVVGLGRQGEDLGRRFIDLSPDVLAIEGLSIKYSGTLFPQVQELSGLPHMLADIDIGKTCILLIDDADRGSDRTCDMELVYNEFYNGLRKKDFRDRWFYPKIIRVSCFGMSNNGSSWPLGKNQVALNVQPNETFHLYEYVLSGFDIPSNQSLSFGLIGIGDSGSSIANEIYNLRHDFTSPKIRRIVHRLDSPINLLEEGDRFAIYNPATGKKEDFDCRFMARLLERYRGIGVIDDISYTGMSVMKIKSVYDKADKGNTIPIIFSPIINFTDNEIIRAPINIKELS